MKFTIILSLLTCLAAVVFSSYNFMDCPKRRVSSAAARVFETLRRCCDSDQLPNGCECFDISGMSDFTNSLLRLPLCPEDLDVGFHLYTRGDKRGTKIKVGDLSSVFDGSKATKIIIHGFTDTAPVKWSLDMMNALLATDDVNVILVNWQKGARPPFYQQCVANTRAVGAMVARLIQKLHESKDAAFESFHLIGQSLGAHTCGIVGKEIQRLTSHSLGRISGLDPSRTLFENYSAIVRLDKNDAHFVDVIHTNANNFPFAAFGIHAPIGHVDFYPNGGKRQPGCPIEILSSMDIDEIIGKTLCSHRRARQLYTDTIMPCVPKPGNCPMGYHANSSCRGTFKVTTSPTQPFCVLESRKN